MERIGTLDDILKFATKLVTPEGEEYYEFPFWFQRSDDGTLIMYLFKELPSDLSMAITKARWGGSNLQPERYERG
jgi:hypothetical protein